LTILLVLNQHACVWVGLRGGGGRVAPKLGVGWWGGCGGGGGGGGGAPLLNFSPPPFFLRSVTSAAP